MDGPRRSRSRLAVSRCFPRAAPRCVPRLGPYPGGAPRGFAGPQPPHLPHPYPHKTQRSRLSNGQVPLTHQMHFWCASVKCIGYAGVQKSPARMFFNVFRYSGIGRCLAYLHTPSYLFHTAIPLEHTPTPIGLTRATARPHTHRPQCYLGAQI